MAQTIEERKEKNRLYQRGYRLSHLEECSKRNLEWQNRNRDKYKTYQERYEEKGGPEKYMFIHAKARAKKRGIEFGIELADISIPATCPYIETALTTKRGRETSYRASLDRIDNSKGYVKGNIQVISQKANTMKCNASINELIMFAKNILKLHGNEVYFG